MVETSFDSEFLRAHQYPQLRLPFHYHTITFNKFLSTLLCLMHVFPLVTVFFSITPYMILMNDTSIDLIGELAVTANRPCLNKRQCSNVSEHLN